jgi:DNA adenine methylase
MEAALQLEVLSESPKPARPFLKWVGGKSSLVGEISKHLPEHINTYYEPFLGGGAVFFALAAQKRMDAVYLSDCNEELINAYQIISNCNALPELIDVLKTLPYDRTVFEKLRARQPKDLTTLVRAVRMIYLNRTGFNGLYRVNKKGEFNVPFGKYTNPLICDEGNLRSVHRVLSDFHKQGHLGISVDDFDVALKAKAGDAVYFDPPYVPISATADFTGYSADGFGHAEQTRLAYVFKQLAEKGVCVIASNSDCAVTRELYAGFTIHDVKARRNINSKASLRGPVGEILVVANGR